MPIHFPESHGYKIPSAQLYRGDFCFKATPHKERLAALCDAAFGSNFEQVHEAAV